MKFPDYYKKYINWKDLYVEMAIVFDNSVVSDLDFSEAEGGLMCPAFSTEQ